MTPYTHINTNIWIWIDCCVGSGCEVNIATRVYVPKKTRCHLPYALYVSQLMFMKTKVKYQQRNVINYFR